MANGDWTNTLTHEQVVACEQAMGLRRHGGKNRHRVPGDSDGWFVTISPTTSTPTELTVRHRTDGRVDREQVIMRAGRLVDELPAFPLLTRRDRDNTPAA